MRGKRFSIGLRATLAIVAVALFATDTPAVAQETVLFSFNSTDGLNPVAGLIFDGAGNLYGTTLYGGANNYGAVFELTPSTGGRWKETVLHSFNLNGTDGYRPYGGLIFDGSGNLYGTTFYGGANGEGTAYELTPMAGGRWKEKVLHSFAANGTDGYNPTASLIFDGVGNLYGTTFYGGANSSGTVFELKRAAGGSWKEKVLHNFTGADGDFPFASLIFDGSGNLYGTTIEGGDSGDGTVFELAPSTGGSWTETVLQNFSGADGDLPYAGLIFDGSGNLYGATLNGGTYGNGTVFELTSSAGGIWTETVLHSFVGISDGSYPYGTLIFDTFGNLHGTTYYGGAHSDGTVFELTPAGGGNWTETVQHSFANTTKDGYYPQAGLILDAVGNLYGTTEYGGSQNYGAVFRFAP